MRSSFRTQYGRILVVKVAGPICVSVERQQQSEDPKSPWISFSFPCRRRTCAVVGPVNLRGRKLTHAALSVKSWTGSALRSNPGQKPMVTFR